LRGLQLADPNYYIPGDIDILFGSDIFWDLLIGGKLTGPAGTPVASRTTLGWLIAGNLSLPASHVMVHFADCNLDECLKSYRELESVPIICTLDNENEKHDLPAATAEACQDVYVDDLMSGAANPEEALELPSQLLELTQLGGSELGNWTSDCPALEHLPPELREA
jgi:hypothetical protein